MSSRHHISIGQGSENSERDRKGFAGRRGFEEQGDPRRGEERTLLACEHGVEVGAARGQHHLVGLDLLGAHVEHDVAEQPPLPHAVHADEGVVVVALGVVGDAVAIAVEELHTPFHGCGRSMVGCPFSAALTWGENRVLARQE